METKELLKIKSALELFPARISGRKTTAKDIAEEQKKNPNVGGGINLQSGVAVIPTGSTSYERNIRRHEALHAIYTDKNQAYGRGLLMQGLEDSRLHLVCSKAEGLAREDEVNTALVDLCSLFAPVPPEPKVPGLQEQWEHDHDLRMLVLTRAMAIIRGGEIPADIQPLVDFAVSHANKINGNVLETVNQALDAIAEGNIAKARRILQPLFRHPESQMPPMGTGEGEGEGEGQEGEDGKEGKGKSKKSKKSDKKDSQKSKSDKSKGDKGDKSEQDGDEQEGEGEGNSEGDKEGEDSEGSQGEGNSSEDRESSTESKSSGSSNQDSPDFDAEDFESDQAENEDAEDGQGQDEDSDSGEGESDSDFEDEDYSDEPTTKYEETVKSFDNKDEQEDEELMQIASAEGNGQMNFDAIQDMPADVVKGIASNAAKLPIMEVHNIANGHDSVRTLLGDKPKSAMSGTEIQSDMLAQLIAAPVAPEMFYETKPKDGGTILIDASGSMGLDNDILSSVAAALPMATIAYYSGGKSRSQGGDLVIYAQNGFRCELKGSLPYRGGTNIVDFPAIQWLLTQKGPRYLVSDGGWTGSLVNMVGAQVLANNSCARGRIKWAKNLGGLLELIPMRCRRVIPENLQQRMIETCGGKPEVFNCLDMDEPKGATLLPNWIAESGYHRSLGDISKMDFRELIEAVKEARKRGDSYATYMDNGWY